MSNLILAEPTELTDAELDMVAAGSHGGHATNSSASFPSISVNVPVNTTIIVQNAIALNILSPGATATAWNLGFSYQHS